MRGRLGARWVVDGEGVPGRALVQPAGSVVTFSLRLGGRFGYRLG